MSWLFSSLCFGDFSALMGGGSSHVMSYAEANNHFDMNEMGKLATKYQHIKQTFPNESGVLNHEGLKKYFLKKGMGQRLANGYSMCFLENSTGEIAFEDYVVGIARAVKASDIMRRKFCFDVFKENEKFITKKSILPIFLEFLEYSFSKCQVKLFKENSDAEKAIDAMFSGFSSPSHPTSLTADEFGKWLSLNIEVSDIIRYSMELELSNRPEIPSTLVSKQVAVPPIIVGESHILKEKHWAQIRTYFPKKYKKNHAMVLLYSTVDDGFSIITLYRKVIGKSRYIEEEPSLVVVRDEGNHIFGGYCNEQWRKVTRDDFYGDEECFVFSVKPEAKVFRPRRTSQDKNFMFSNPKVIAMGGKKTAFGFSLDEDLYEGTSNFNSTYGCKQLSSTPTFRISVVEVWGFIDEDEPLELYMMDVRKKEDLDQGSVLNDKKNTFILDLIGRGQSANCRDTD